jgi:hypothetical protein
MWRLKFRILRRSRLTLSERPWCFFAALSAAANFYTQYVTPVNERVSSDPRRKPGNAKQIHTFHNILVMTTYQIEKRSAGYLLDRISGPCKLGHESIPATDVADVEKVLTVLHCPQSQISDVMAALRSHLATQATFDARVWAP